MYTKLAINNVSGTIRRLRSSEYTAASAVPEGAEVFRRSCLIALALGAAIASPAMATAPHTFDYDALIERARAGDQTPALDMLRARVAADTRAARDRVVIAGWAGFDAEVISSYLALPHDFQSSPDMIEATVRAYRNEKKFSKALTLARKGLQVAPKQRTFRISETIVLADLVDPAAVPSGEKLVRDAPLDPDAHAALGYAYSRSGRAFDALRSFDRAVEIAPTRADLRRERVFAYSRAGLAAPALGIVGCRASPDGTGATSRASERRGCRACAPCADAVQKRGRAFPCRG